MNPLVHSHHQPLGELLSFVADRSGLHLLMTDDNSAVSLNEAPAGTPITVTIPNNDRRTDIRIRGIEAGKIFIVRPLARGYASRLGGRKVSSP